jgi:hypothetical protein
MRFIISVLASLVITTVLWVTLNFARMGEAVEPRIANSCDTIEMKRMISNQTGSPKIAVIGASNVLFGVRTHMIEEKVGIPSMNVGLPASLGIDIILSTAKSILKPKDIALLTLELFFFIDQNLDGPFIREALFQCSTDAFFDLSRTDQARALLLQSAPNLAHALTARAARSVGLTSFARQPGGPPFPRAGFNSHGDFLENDSWRVTREQREWVREHPGGTILEYSNKGPAIQAVQRFVAWARDNHVIVLATWPAVYWPRRALAQDGLQKIKAYYESLGVLVIGDPTDTMLQLDHFFDTNNHLTAEAAEGRTERLVQQLRPILRTKSGEPRTER